MRVAVTVVGVMAFAEIRLCAALVGTMFQHEVQLSLPKLTLSYDRTLTSDLTALGMGVAFTDNADFSRMSSACGCDLRFVEQKAFVQIDEEGTVAAAVTVTGVQTAGLVLPIVMRVTHPYLFVIRDQLSGTILFIGKVAMIPSGN